MKTARQQYWHNLEYIHDVTGEWIRNTSFSAAHEIAFALEYYVAEGYSKDRAEQRAYDHVKYNRNGTLVLRGARI